MVGGHLGSGDIHRIPSFRFRIHEQRAGALTAWHLICVLLAHKLCVLLDGVLHSLAAGDTCIPNVATQLSA